MRATYKTPTGTRVYIPYINISKETNTLIAGCVGSGKSELIHSIIYTLCTENTPDKVNLWLCDPKKVELEKWRSLPHTAKYADTKPGILDLLDELRYLMLQRYSFMKSKGIVRWQGTELYLIVDELADLMVGATRKQFVERFTEIMQLSRAAGIHVIAGTQSPSRHTIPAEFQLNFTCQVGLKCRSAIESKQVIGIAGAEKITAPGSGYIASRGEVTLCRLPMTEESDKKWLVNWYSAQDNDRVRLFRKWA